MISRSAEQTKRIAADFAATLSGGEVVALKGDLGAGKTTFVQGMCGGLGIAGPVTSPTFAIMNVYGGRLRVAHLDLYRLKSAREIAALGLEEFLGAPDTVTVIEWPDAVSGVEWKPTHVVTLAATSSGERAIEIAYGNGGTLFSTGT